MTELIFFAAGFTISTALALRNFLTLRAICEQWERNYEAECRRHDEDLRLREQREAIAAANIVQLSRALQDATTQAAHGRGGVRIGESVASRFCVN